MDPQGAVGAARRAEREIRQGRVRGPLHGVPVAVKDVIATAGLRTTAGSWVLRDWIPGRDAAVVAALRNAGAVILGKTHTTEFAVWGTGGHPMYRLPRNPWDPCRVPGGSSTGSGIATAARLAAAAIGTDTGGSTRIPASFCGVVGLKPTRATLSTEGVIPLSPSYDHVGVMARSAADVAAVLEAVGTPPDRRRTVSMPTDLQGVRIGTLTSDAQPDQDVATAVSEVGVVFARLGASLSDVVIPSMSHAAAISRAVQHTELLAYHQRGIRRRPQEYGSDVIAACHIGEAITPVEFVRAQRAGSALTREVDAALRGVDAFLSPTVGFTAPVIGEESIHLDGRLQNVNTAISGYTRLYNITGHPALSVPCGFDSAGLPIGLQLIGRHGRDQELLRIGSTYERATGWSARRPELDLADKVEI
jgi:aspartyl-tRNA(Asn)/glutamyl-tRNA(Gln) amidotransferase subunit A